MKFSAFIALFTTLCSFVSHGQFIENKGQVLDLEQNYHPEVKYYYSSSNAGVYFHNDRVVYNFKEVDEVDESLYSEDQKKYKEALEKREVTYHRMDLIFENSNSNVQIQTGEKLPGVNHFYLNKRNGIRDVRSFESITYQDLYSNIDVVFHNSKKGMKYDIVLHEAADIKDVRLKFEGYDVKIEDNQLLILAPFGNITEEIPLSFINDDKTQKVKVEYILNEDGTISFDLKENVSYSKLTIDPVLEWASYFNQVIDPSGFSNTLDYISNHVDADGNYYSFGQCYSNAGNYPVVNPGGAYTDVYDNSSDLYLVKFDANRQLVWGTYLGGSSGDDASWGRPIKTVGNTLHIVGDRISSGAPYTNGGGFYEAVDNRNFWARFNKNTGGLQHLTSLSNGFNPSIDISPSGQVAIVSDNYGGSSTWYLPLMNRAGAYNQSVNGGFKDMGLIMFDASYNQIWGTFLGGPGSQEGYTCAFDSNDNLYFAGGTSWSSSSTAGNEQLVNLAGAYNQSAPAGGEDVKFGKFNSSGQLVWHSLYGGNDADGRIGAMGTPAVVKVHPTTDELVLSFNTTSTDLPVQTLPGAYNRGLPSDPDFGAGGSFWNYAAYIAKFSTAGVRNWGTYFYGSSTESGTIMQNIIFGGCNKFYIGAAGIASTLTGASSGYNLLNTATSSRNGFVTMLDAGSFGFEWDSYLNSDHALDCYVAANTNQARFFAVSKVYYENIPVVDPGNGAYYESTSWDASSSTLGIFQFHPSIPPNVPDETTCSGVSVTLNASGGMGAPYNWYSSSTSSTILNTGSSYTVSPTSTTTYYVSSGTGMCASPRTPVTVTVNPAPAAPVISSNSPICEGGTINLTSNNISGATYNWSGPNSFSSSLEDPSISSATSAMAGTYTCSVTVSGCPSPVASTTVNINTNSTAPTGITGTSSICSGNSTTLTLSGGSAGTGATAEWFTSSCGGTSAGSGNSITVSPGSTTTYFVRYEGTCNTTACASQTVTVTAPPSAGILSGNQNICDGSTTTFSSTQGGGSWSSSNTGVATVNSSGVVTGQSAGTATITYTVTGSGGCPNATATRTVTVTAPPSAGTLSGNQNICVGSTTTFSSSQGGGSWSTSNGGVATVNSSGVVTGQTAGTATITYTITGTGGCPNATATRTVTVTAPPSAGTLSGTQTICDGATTTFTSTQGGGSWSSSNTGIASVNASGVVTGQSDGTATITYTVAGSGGCSNATATRTVTVNALPTVTVPSGGNVCEGETLSLSPSSGGTWTSSDAGVATIDNSGLVTGVSAGTADMTFTETSTGCTSMASAGTITVNSAPSFTASSTDPTSCGATDGTITISGLNASTSYDVSLASGSATSENSNAAGEIVITGLGAGSYSPIEVIINGCSTIDNGTYDLNDPSSPTISVPNGGVVCEGETLNLTPTTGGTWSSSDASVATITNGGVLTGVSGGTATVIYTETSTGCSSLASSGAITVNASPTVTVPSGGVVCEGETLNLSPSSGGTWTSSDAGVATIDNSGLVTGVSSGTADMTFTETSTGCSSSASSGTITVNPLPTFTASVTDPSSCGATDGTITISGLNGSTTYDVSLSSGAPTTETSNGAGEIVMTGLGAGSYSPIEVTLNGCSTIDNGTYDLNDPSSPAITVPNGGELCEGDTLNVLPDTGGTWTSNDPSVATINNAGVLAGISAGTTTVIYTETSTGCSSLASAGSITVNPTPTVTIPNGGQVCEGASLNLTPDTGGTWTSNDASVATVTNSGEVTGVSAGTTDVVFTNTTTGCSSLGADGTVIVNAAPMVNVPTDNTICVGDVLNVSPSAGGTWSSNDATVATVTNSGEVTGVSQGITTVVFTDTATGCSSLSADGEVIVNAIPTLTIGEISCNKPNGTYAVEYSTDAGATVTSSVGTVTSTLVTGVPNDQQVIITATTQGCPSTEQTVSTTECNDVVVSISNGVSPNDDGINDVFSITNLDAYPNHVLTIYNRWGDKVFQASPYENDWNGENNTGGLGGKALPAGTYFYVLELEEGVEPMKGYVELKK